MKTKKIKFWARIGQIAFICEESFAAILEMQSTTYVSEFSGTITEGVAAVLGLISYIVLTEAIVRIIIYFSELHER